MKPIELLFIYNKLEKKKIGNNNFYDLKIKKILNEFKLNKYKPGFYNQTLSMINVIKHNKVDKKFCNVITAIENIKFLSKILK